MEATNLGLLVDTAIHGDDAFSRLDETDDAIFYSRDRFVCHLDTVALGTVSRLIGKLVIEQRPRILDLMASWDSHLPKGLEAQEVIGLGLNEHELAKNPRLTEWIQHDINQDPRLPFESDRFDLVLNVVSVDYLTRPLEVFSEVARVLKPGGVHLVFFSNRMFPEKAVKVWSQATESERVQMVRYFFSQSGGFLPPRVYSSIGKPRPCDDKYAHTGLPSDPVYLVYAEKPGKDPARAARPSPAAESADAQNTKEQFERRKAEIKTSLRCPHCGRRMKKWAVPQSPFTEWDNEFMYICFNDACPYLERGWQVMQDQGNFGLSYRCMYNPERDTCMPVPVRNLKALRESIVEEEAKHGS